jgi:small conductance mechanosensitive channel
MEKSVQEAIDNVVEIVTTYGLDVLGAIVILVVGLMVAGWAQRAVQKALGRFERFDATLRVFFASMVRYLIIIFTVLAVLNQFGVQTTSLIAVLGAAGLAIGLALQGTLSNLAAGVMLLIFRPFKVGDVIEADGQAGSVQSLTLFVTELNTPDNIRIIVPNGRIWGAPIRNVSFNSTRRVEMAVGIGYGDDIGKAMAAIQAVIGADSRALDEPEPLIAVTELADNSVNLVVRVWCASGDYWPVKFDMTRAIKEKLDAEGISIPYPQRDVHLYKSD